MLFLYSLNFFQYLMSIIVSRLMMLADAPAIIRLANCLTNRMKKRKHTKHKHVKSPSSYKGTAHTLSIVPRVQTKIQGIHDGRICSP
jgi:hypothetical protein